MTTPQITVPSSMPDPLQPQPDFDAVFSAALAELLTAFGQTNTVATWMNTTAIATAASATAASGSATDALAQAVAAAAARDIAEGFAKYKGDYDAETLYAVGESVTYESADYVKKTTAPAGTTPVEGVNWRSVTNGRVPVGAAVGYYDSFGGATPTPPGFILHSVPVVVDPVSYPALAEVFSANTFDMTTYDSPDPEASGRYGADVALSDSFMAVGARSEDVGATSGAGRVHVITLATGAVQTIDCPDPQGNGDFGSVLAMTDTYLAVQHKSDDETTTNSGCVYVYTNSGGTFGSPQKIKSANIEANSDFGSAIAITDTYLAVGAWGETVSAAADAGRVYVYTNSGGTFGSAQTIESPNSEAGGRFGWKVDLTDTYLAIGAEEEDGGASGAGRAYVYTNSGGTFGSAQTFQNPSPVSNSNYGFDVAITDTHLAVGTEDRDRVYVYTNSGGTFGSVSELSELPSASYGQQVALSGNQLLIYGTFESVVGAALYENSGSGFEKTKTLLNPNSGENITAFAISSGHIALANESATVDALSAAGEVYLFDQSEPRLTLYPISGATTTATRVQ